MGQFISYRKGHLISKLEFCNKTIDVLDRRQSRGIINVINLGPKHPNKNIKVRPKKFRLWDFDSALLRGVSHRYAITVVYHFTRSRAYKYPRDMIRYTVNQQYK